MFFPRRDRAPEHLAGWNAALQTGLKNPLDDAVVQVQQPDLARLRKIAEIPFDFTRKRVSVVIQDDSGVRLITKGAFDHVLEACTRVVDGRTLDASSELALRSQYERWTNFQRCWWRRSA